MSKADSVARKLHSSNDCIAKGNKVSTDFMTSNNFYHQMTANSQQVLKETGKEVNPIIDSLAPETFEVTAKKYSTLWKTKQYTDAEFRKDLMNTVDRKEAEKLPDYEVTESMREKRFNNVVTNVSEYANALNRGRIFINPKFSSC